MNFSCMSFTLPPFPVGVASQKVTYSFGECSGNYTFLKNVTYSINFATTSFPVMNTVSVPYTVSGGLSQIANNVKIGPLIAVKLYKINNLGVRTAITVTGTVSGSNAEFAGLSVGEYMVSASH